LVGPDPTHEQWRCSPVFILQKNRDGKIQKKKKEKEKEKDKEKEKEKGKSRLPCVAVMSGWRSKRRRPVVN